MLGVGAIFLSVLGTGCEPVVNFFAFFPDRSFMLRAEQLPRSVRHVFFSTADGERIEGFVVAGSGSNKLVVYFHGNGGNIAQRVPELQEIARSTGATVFGVGYRGYGASTGRPSERGIYRDGEAALRYARDELGFPDERMVLFGRSLGTTVAVHLGKALPVAAIVLVTPLSSGREMAKIMGLGWLGFLVRDSFDNLAGAPDLIAPVLVIHGTSDEVVPFAQGKRVFDAIVAPKRFVEIPGGRHNDLEFENADPYWGTIASFLSSPPL